MRILISLFASRKTAVFLLIAGIAGSLVKAQLGWGDNYPLIAVLVLLSINLVTCLAINAKRIWRRSAALFTFHIGLIGLSLACLVSGLTYFHGYFQLTEDQSIHNEFASPTKGPLHRENLEGFQMTLRQSRVAFHENELGVKIDEHSILVERPDGGTKPETIRYNKPILHGAYRFYLAMDLGYALVFRFTDSRGVTTPGVVYLPKYPDARNNQFATFFIPDTKIGQLAATVDLKNGPYSKKKSWTLEVPDDAKIDLAYSENGTRKRVTMGPEQSTTVAGGSLVFEGMRTWHGFLVDYDPARPFLALSTVIIFIGLTWHYALRTLKPRATAGDQGRRTPPRKLPSVRPRPPGGEETRSETVALTDSGRNI